MKKKDSREMANAIQRMLRREFNASLWRSVSQRTGDISKMSSTRRRRNDDKLKKKKRKKTIKEKKTASCERRCGSTSVPS